MSKATAYVGTELELFAHAKTWKAYFAAKLRPFIRGEVLEVGAGIGNTTPVLFSPGLAKWTCLEPDPQQAEILADSLGKAMPTERVEVITGTIEDVGPGRFFDSIVYIDVLEHIEHDAAELRAAARLLRKGGTLIVLAPACQGLYSEFDRAVGHFRRYDSRSLRQIAPPGLCEEGLIHLDSVGLLASLFNRSLLRQSMPTIRQILIWDRLLVPVSRVLDPLMMYKIGRTIVAIWRKSEKAP